VQEIGPEWAVIYNGPGRSRSINAKPHDNRGASQDRHIAVASFRCVTATRAGGWSPASGSTCSKCHL